MLRLVALGHTSGEIAKRLYISPRGRDTPASLQRKLGVNGRRELVPYALERVVIHR